jgi:hypothetical protein
MRINVGGTTARGGGRAEVSRRPDAGQAGRVPGWPQLSRIKPFVEIIQLSDALAMTRLLTRQALLKPTKLREPLRALLIRLRRSNLRLCRVVHYRTTLPYKVECNLSDKRRRSGAVNRVVRYHQFEFFV